MFGTQSEENNSKLVLPVKKYLQQSGSSFSTKRLAISSGSGSHGSPFFKSSRVFAIRFGLGGFGGNLGRFFEVDKGRTTTFGCVTNVTGRVGGL